MSRLEQLLEPFRDNEREDQLAGVVDNPDAIRTLAAWRSVRWTWTAKKGAEPEDLGERWLWIWQGGRFDLEALSASAGRGQAVVELVLGVLVNARVVYPDGTVTAHAQQLIEAHVKQKYPTRKGGRPLGSKNRPKETAE